jgi:hypothetical protein
LILPPAPHPPEAHNPQGPALAQGRGMQRQLAQQQTHIETALKDVDDWVRQPPYFELAISDDKDDVLRAHHEAHDAFKTAIQSGNRTLRLTNISIAHLPPSVLQHFDNFYLYGLDRLCNLRIPASVGAQGKPPYVRKVHVESCSRLYSVTVADNQQTSINVQVVPPTTEFAKARACKDVAGVFVCVKDCGGLQEIDLSQTVASDVALYGCTHTPSAVPHLIPGTVLKLFPPPALCTLRGKIHKEFDPQGDIFLHMLRNRTAQVWAKGQSSEGTVRLAAFSGAVRMAQVSLVMQQCVTEIKAAARLAGVPTPCLQEMCLQEFFGPVLRTQLRKTTWLDDPGLLPENHEESLEITPPLAQALRLAIKQVSDQGLGSLFAHLPQLQDFLEAYPNRSPLIRPGTLAEICIQGLVKADADADADADKAELETTLGELSLHNTGAVLNWSISVMPASDPPAFTRIAPTQWGWELGDKIWVSVKPNRLNNCGILMRVSPDPRSRDQAIDLIQAHVATSHVLYDCVVRETTDLKSDSALVHLPPGTTSVVLRGVVGSAQYDLPKP